MSDFENELLGLAEDGPQKSKKRRQDNKSKSKPKGFEDDSDSGSEMDMDLESEEGEGDLPKKSAPSKSKAKPVARSAAKGVSNPYPVEGKYLDEDDRDYLDTLPEIEREDILAARQEEMQKYKDSQQLDAMYRLAGMGGDDDAESEEEPSRKKRKHTSVSKEASRAMKDLKNKRKAKDERDATRAQRRDRHHRSNSDASSGSDEDGEISHSQSKNDRTAYSPDRSPDGKDTGRRSPKRQDIEKELDAMPPNAAELNSARLGRYEIVDMMYMDGFDAVAVGCYVRLMAGEPDQYGRPKYRIHRIEEIQDGSYGPYKIEYKGKQIVEERVLLVSYGKLKRLFRIADVSNGDIEDSEYSRFEATNRADGVKIPKRSDLSRKHTAIREMRDRAKNSEEINRQVEARKRSNPAQQRHKITIEITNLITARNHAVRRNESALIEKLNREIVAMGGDPQTGELTTLDRDEAAKNASEYDDRIEKINENNKKKVKDQMAKAHQGSLARKKAEEAIVKETQAKTKAAQLLEEAEKAKKAAEARGEVIDLANEDEVKVPFKAVPVLPTGGLKKGETPQQFVARTIDLDLGDF